MNDLRITRSGFRGVIQPMLTKRGWFLPVARDYRKRKQEFVLVNRQGLRRAGDIAFTFSPTIHVNTDRTDLRSDFTRIFPTLNVRRVEQADSSNAVTREFSSAQQTKVSEVLSSLFSTLSKTVREITRSRSRERSFQATAQSRKESPEFFPGAFAPLRENTVTTTRSLNHFTHVTELKLFTNQLASSKTTNSHQDRWLFLRSKDTESGSDTSSTTNVFTTLSLNFASRKVSETELVHQQIARFASSPELTYAKRQQAMSEGIVQALRGLRAPEPEAKRVAAPALPSIEQITHQVKTQLERELRIERERRGL